MLSTRITYVREQVSDALSRSPFLLILALTLGMNPCDFVRAKRSIEIKPSIVRLAIDRLEVYERRAVVAGVCESCDIETLAAARWQLPNGATVDFTEAVRVRVPSLVLDEEGRELIREADKPEPGVRGILAPALRRFLAARIG